MNKKGNFPIFLGLLLILGALALCVYNFWDSARAGQAAQEILTALDIPEELHDPAELRWQHPVPSEEPQEVPEMPVQEEAGYFYIGVLDVPCYNLKLPVMREWTYNRLQISPCVYTGSYYSNDLVICGHNYSTHFSLLKGIDLGEHIFLTTVDGYVYHYLVDNVETVSPTEVERMITGDWDLTLFTCNTGGLTRCAIRCVLANPDGSMQ